MKVTALALDPIEKKPLARFHPGSLILSVGGLGCTMHCPWCQNHHIAQPDDPNLVATRDISSGELVDCASDLVERGNIGIAYTYNEPLLHWRDVLDCSQRAHESDLLNVVVTNGLIALPKLEELLPYTDAFNIDLKGFDQSVYDVTGGSLETVKRTIEEAAAHSHVEVTTLLVPGINDDMRMIEEEARWLASLDASIPLHLTRFFPHHEFASEEATSLETLEKARETARAHLDDVILGNV